MLPWGGEMMEGWGASCRRWLNTAAHDPGFQTMSHPASSVHDTTSVINVDHLGLHLFLEISGFFHVVHLC